jgi:glutamate carboxypeptidase
MMSPVELLRHLVELESPTGDANRMAHIGRFVAAELEGLGASVALHGEAVVGEWSDGDQKPLVLAAHMDTVWPAGTLRSMPFRIEDGFAWGPGALDMKAGIAMGVEAVRRLGRPHRPLAFLITADEEIGSPAGRAVVEELARTAAAVLVLEPPVREGTITTKRSGLARYQMHIAGRAAHAGNGARAGVSAVEELARQTLALHALPDAIEGARVNVGQVGGGTGDNVVAGEAWARIDARAWTSDAQRELEQAIRGLEPHLDGARITITGGVTRPPMIQSPAAGRLAETAIAIAADLGVELAQHVSAGGSDGNFAAAVGTPVIDGLGPNGVGAHAVDERVSLESLEERIGLLEALLRRL